MNLKLKIHIMITLNKMLELLEILDKIKLNIHNENYFKFL